MISLLSYVILSSINDLKKLIYDYLFYHVGLKVILYDYNHLKS